VVIDSAGVVQQADGIEKGAPEIETVIARVKALV
jgi:hypothetical protein